MIRLVLVLFQTIRIVPSSSPRETQNSLSLVSTNPLLWEKQNAWISWWWRW